MMSHAKSVDNRIDEACDTGVLILAGKNLRSYPINSEEEAPFNHKDLLELGKQLRGVGRFSCRRCLKTGCQQ